MKKLHHISLSILFNLLVLVLLLSSRINGVISSEVIPQPSYDEIETMAWNATYIWGGYASDSIEWSFNGSNPNIGISVWAIDEENLDKYLNGTSHIIYELSNGTKTYDSDTFDVPHSGDWNIMMRNLDPDKEESDVHIIIKFDPGVSDGYNGV